MERRTFVALAAGAFLWPELLRAQAPRRIAFLGVTPAGSETTRAMLGEFRKGLADQGLAESRDYTIDFAAEPRIEELFARVVELLRRSPAVFVAITTPAAQAAAKATAVTPIVFGAVSDPVGSGLVRGLSRPTGNVTGVSNMLPPLSGKLLELARELMPDVSRVAMLWNPDNPAKAIEAEELRAAAKAMDLAVEELPARTIGEIEVALSAADRGRPRLLVILADALTESNRTRIAELARIGRMAVVSNYSRHVEAGGVLSYAPDYNALNRRLGAFAGRILKGARPADLPVELPAKFELLINRRAAKALGITVPQSLILRADRVIE